MSKPQYSRINQRQARERHSPFRRVLDIGLDLILIFAFSVTMLVIVLLSNFDGSVIRTVLGFVFALFVPGYLFIAALFPHKSDLTLAERLAFSVGLSIALVPVAGVILNSTSFGIRLVPMTTLLFILASALGLTAAWRRQRVPVDERFSWQIGARFHQTIAAIRPPKRRVDQAIALVLIGSILVSAVVVAYVLLVPKQEAGFTEFYLLGRDGKIGGYPQLKVGQPQQVVVNINNQEHRDTTYDLVIALQNNSTSSILHQETVTIPNNQTWQKTIDVVPDSTGAGQKLDFLLYVNRMHTVPYREAYLLVNVTSPAV